MTSVDIFRPVTYKTLIISNYNLLKWLRAMYPTVGSICFVDRGPRNPLFLSNDFGGQAWLNQVNLGQSESIPVNPGQSRLKDMYRQRWTDIDKNRPRLTEIEKV